MAGNSDVGRRALHVFHVGEDDPGRALARIVEVELIAREIDEVTVEISGNAGAVRRDKAVERLGIGGGDPARELELGRLEIDRQPVFHIEPILEHIELQWPDDADERGRAVAWPEHLHDPFLRQLLQRLLELLRDRKSTRLNSSHPSISYAVFCLKKKNNVDTTNALSHGRSSSPVTGFSKPLLADDAAAVIRALEFQKP